MQRSAQMSLALTEPKVIASFKFIHTSGKKLLILHEKQPMENHRDLPMISPIDLKDNSNDEVKLPAFAVYADCLQD
jgi:hypothetical protein